MFFFFIFYFSFFYYHYYSLLFRITPLWRLIIRSNRRKKATIGAIGSRRMWRLQTHYEPTFRNFAAPQSFWIPYQLPRRLIGCPTALFRWMQHMLSSSRFYTLSSITTWCIRIKLIFQCHGTAHLLLNDAMFQSSVDKMIVFMIQNWISIAQVWFFFQGLNHLNKLVSINVKFHGYVLICAQATIMAGAHERIPKASQSINKTSKANNTQVFR